VNSALPKIKLKISGFNPGNNSPGNDKTRQGYRFHLFGFWCGKYKINCFDNFSRTI